MQFEELKKRCTALMAREVVFSYFSRTLRMRVTPEYGYDQALKSRHFQLIFYDCIFLKTLNTSRFADSGETEFVVWGKHKLSHCRPECKLTDWYTGRALRFDGFTRPSIDSLEEFEHAFFANVLGDTLDVVFAGLTVKESERKRGEG